MNEKKLEPGGTEWKQFCEVLDRTQRCPEWVRVAISSSQSNVAISYSEKTVTTSYLDFLQEQIDLSARGPEWSKSLGERLLSLKPFVGQKMIVYFLTQDSKTYALRARATDLMIVHEDNF